LIHLYRFQELNILLDVGSGAVHILDDAAADDLRAGRDNEELDALVREGTLHAPEPDADAFSPEGRGAVVKAMCLHVAHDCNMRCGYCFADAGGFGGARGLMSLETGRRAIDCLLAASGARRNLEVDFFGGEPLMNWDVVRALVLYGREREKPPGKHLRFTLTTNGLLLDDEKTAFLNEHMDNVILSIDGRPVVNDRMRKTAGGEGTYGKIIDKLLRFKDAREAAGKLYYVRGTYTRHNLDFAEDVKHLAGLGFKNISVEPAVVAEDDPQMPWALTEKDLPALCAEYDRLAAWMREEDAAGRPVSFFHFKIDLEQGPCVYKRAAGCGAGTEYVAVTPEGDVYPCHQFVGEEGYRLGSLETAGGRQACPALCCRDAAPTVSGATNKESSKTSIFSRAHIHTKAPCRECWAKYYCSGGCHANALHFEGDILTPHRLSCALERKRVECAIGLLAAKAVGL
jgi:uncharacterized protein